MVAESNNTWRIVHSEASTGWGGQEHRTLAELAGFQRRGCEVCLIAPTKSAIYQRATTANIPVQPLARSKILFPFAALRFGMIMSRVHARRVHVGEADWPADVDEVIPHRGILGRMLDGTWTG